MSRKTPQLNLQAELPEVRSTDFNLFYKPQAKPVDKSVEVFTRSLDNFVNNAGTSLTLLAEAKEKEINEAEAVAKYNENRINFNKAVEKGDIPKEANPYFIEKYKELELNGKAQQFQQQLFTRYKELDVLENPDPQAFDKFYNDEIKKFVAENNLGIYDPVQLEKGFFTKTTGARNQLFQTHVTSQMSKISEDYDLRFKENLQIIFQDDGTIEDKGSQITAFIQDAVKNGGGKVSSRNLLMESLKDYVNTTKDFEGASRLIRELPKNIKLGTDVLFNVQALQNDFDELAEILDDRERQEIAEQVQLNNNLKAIEGDTIYNSLDKFNSISEYRQSEEYNNLSATGKTRAEKIYSQHFAGYSEKTNDQSRSDVQELIKKNQLSEAKDYLEENQMQFTEREFENIRNTIIINEATKKDGLLEHRLFTAFESDLRNKIKATAQTSGSVSFFNESLVSQFEFDAKQWLSSNQLSKFNGDFSQRQSAFIDFISKRRNEYLNYIREQSIVVDDPVPTTEEREIEKEKASKDKIKKRTK